jgi:hypothetical protein
VKAESAELSRQLQAQVAKVEELGKSHVTLKDTQRNLQQANVEMV